MENSKKQDDIDFDSVFKDEIVDTEKEIQQRKKQEMIEKIKKVGKATGTIIVVCFIVYWMFSSEVKNKDIQNTPSESEIKETALKNDLVEKYNAIIFANNDYSFSKNLQENIDRNFLIEGWVHDIFKENDKYFIKVEGYGYFGIFEISDDNMKYVIESKNEDSILDIFFIIIKPNAVSKSLFEMKAERDGEDTYAYNEASDDFLLKGIVLDIKKMD